jgi:hypothetical protein
MFFLTVVFSFNILKGQPYAFKHYGCWGRASRSAPAYPGFLGDAPKQANSKCCQVIQKGR